eukprot:scaffold126325_cov20-Tisochrysis_lutea.AAC.3
MAQAWMPSCMINEHEQAWDVPGPLICHAPFSKRCGKTGPWIQAESSLTSLPKPHNLCLCVYHIAAVGAWATLTLETLRIDHGDNAPMCKWEKWATKRKSPCEINAYLCTTMAAEQQQPYLTHAYYGPLQPERLQPLLPFASAMALLPARDNHKSLKLQYHLPVPWLCSLPGEQSCLHFALLCSMKREEELLTAKCMPIRISIDNEMNEQLVLGFLITPLLTAPAVAACKLFIGDMAHLAKP